MAPALGPEHFFCLFDRGSAPALAADLSELKHDAEKWIRFSENIMLPAIS
jgi:hypothetical protein